MAETPRYTSVTALLADCRPLLEAITATFDRVWQHEDGSRHAECCGAEVSYGGIMGTSEARCRTCGSVVLDVTAPECSPVLMAPEGNYTHVASAAFCEEMKGREWLGWRKKPVEVLEIANG